MVKIPAFKVKVVDTIGAGDAFTAGLICKLIEQGREGFFANIRNNMIFASAVSAIISKSYLDIKLFNIIDINRLHKLVML